VKCFTGDKKLFRAAIVTLGMAAVVLFPRTGLQLPPAAPPPSAGGFFCAPNGHSGSDNWTVRWGEIFRSREKNHVGGEFLKQTPAAVRSTPRQKAGPQSRYDLRDAREPANGRALSPRSQNACTALVAVVDPMGDGRQRIQATVNRRVDILEMERSHRTEAQPEAGI
jgi:hypothetical protein